MSIECFSSGEMQVVGKQSKHDPRLRSIFTAKSSAQKGSVCMVSEVHSFLGQHFDAEFIPSRQYQGGLEL